MALTFVNIQDHVLGLIDRDDSDTRTKVKAYINMTGRDIWTAHEWRERRDEGTITTVAPYSTGSVSSSSTTITGSGTTFPSYTAGLATFALSYSDPPYTIATRDSATQLTLADAYNETALSGSTYVAFQDVYTLGSTVERLIDIRLLATGYDGPLGALTERRLEQVATIPGEAGKPTVYAVLPQTAAGLKKVRVWPVPDAAYRLKYRFLKTYTDMSADADECVVPETRRDLLVCGTLRWAYRLAGQYQKAQNEDARFEALLLKHIKNEGDHGPLGLRLLPFDAAIRVGGQPDWGSLGVPV